MNTRYADGRVTFEPLVREERVQDAFKDFCRQCKAYNQLGDAADAALKAAEALTAAIRGAEQKTAGK